MEKFRDIVYERPDMDALTAKIDRFVADFKLVKDFDEANRLFLALQDELKSFKTMFTVAHIRNTINTADAFFENEMAFWASANPLAQLKLKAVYELLLASPFVEQFEAAYGDIYIKNLKNNILFASEAALENKVKESRLTQQYAKASAICTTTFHGENVNFYGLLKYMQSTDRKVRREAFLAWSDLYASVAGELDAIYDQLIAVRCEMARTLGFKDFVDMAYAQRGRFDYNRDDVKNFRRQVVEIIVPVCQKLFEEQRKRLGIEKLHFYDESLVFPEGNAVPEGTTEELVAKAQQMYRELSKESAEFFDFMVEHELFDLETKPGKRQGGYCTSLLEYKAPFIFSNFNGTSADVDVLTHEAGHAFESFCASRILPLADLVWSTSEINEIHSMSMEFFTYPWMHLFFGENTSKYYTAHLVSCITKIPYMACVDAFQHRVYEEMLTDAASRRQAWHELEQIYMPWRDYDGNTFLEEGGFWMQKQHIFLYPFYYIDYALAQMGAFEFYGRMKEDRQKAWADYYRLCCAGGSKGYFDLLDVAELKNPFADGTVAAIVNKLLPDIL